MSLAVTEYNARVCCVRLAAHGAIPCSDCFKSPWREHEVVVLLPLFVLAPLTKPPLEVVACFQQESQRPHTR